MKTLTIAFAVLLVSITTITKAQTVATPGNTPSPTVSKFNDIVQVNFNDISSQQNWVTVGFNNVFAYRPVNYFSMGIGVGLEYDNPGMVVPVSADFRYYFMPGKYVTPFLNLNGGYAFAGSGEGFNSDNIFIGLNIGINIMVEHNMSLQMALGVKDESYSNQNYDLFKFRTADNVTMPFTIGLVF